MTQDVNETAVDYHGLLQANLDRVFNERDAARRRQTIAELYEPEAVLYEPQTEAKGHAAINAAVEALLASLPPDFAFTVTAPAVGHHSVGRLRWQGGPSNGPAVVTGTDVAFLANGRIHALYVLLDVGKE
jgi:hypothetical protein